MEQRRSKRARISLACISCREHKTRCDGERPLCGFCQRRNPRSQTPCVYQNQAKARESKDIQNLLQRINQLEGELAVANPLKSGPGTGSSGSHDQSPSSNGQVFRRAEPEREPLLDTLPAVEISEGGGITIDTEQQSPIVSQRNSGLFQPDVRTDQIGSGSLRTQDRHFDISNDQGGSANGSTSRMLPNSVYESSRARPSNAESDVHLQRETFLRARRPEEINDDLQVMAPKTPKGNDEPYFYGESSTTTLMQEVHDIISPSAGVDFSSNTDPSRGEPSVYSAPENYPRREEGIPNLHSNYLTVHNHMNDFDLPPRSLADHLLNSYFNRVHILYPFLHRPTFEAAYEKMWTPKDVVGSRGRLNSLADAGLGNLANSGPESRVFYVGINAIFALSCQFSDLPIAKGIEAAKGYLERAMALLLHAELLDNPSISLVQVLLLLCLHLQSTPLRNRLWNIIGMAFRMAQGLALQVDDGEGHGARNTKSSLEIEMRRRIWYSCVMLDMTVSMTLGRTSMASNGYTIPFPRAIDDENLHLSTSLSSPGFAQPQVGISLTSFFVEAIKLSELTDKMLKALYPEPATIGKNIAIVQEGEEDSAGGFDVVMNLETMLTRLHVDLPPELRWPKGSPNTFDRPSRPTAEPTTISKCLERQRNVLHTRLLYLKILLYRPLFLRLCRERIPQQTKNPQIRPSQQQAFRRHTSSGFEDSTTIRSYFATRCSTECFRAAEELIILVHTTHHTNAASAWWYSLFYAYTTGIVIILTRFCPPLMDILGISRIDESWVLCQEILKDMAIYGSHANRCLISLQDLRSRLASWESGPSNSLHETQNLVTVADRLNHDQSTSNTFYNNSSPNHVYEDAPSRRREGPSALNHGGQNTDSGMSSSRNPQDRNCIPATLGHPELEPGAEWAGMLPWDVDFDTWWTFDMMGADFGPTPGSEAGYL